ncbi:MAG: PTS sugar transporter subunit IIA [Candidatus Omnitrophica bacterium]|nr:PTS sugar transporter subunit IIA [Candidatus Omnitrophota bacterium]
MGTFIVFLTMLFLLLGFIWYRIYGQKRATQDSALIYMLENMLARDKELTSDNLLTELKDIVMQRDKVTEDRFHRMIEESVVLDIGEPLRMDDFFKDISEVFAKSLDLDSKELYKKFLEREQESSTVLRKGLSIPHIVVQGKNVFKILLVRARSGIIFPGDKLAHIVFVLVGSSDERNLHLKVLAAIAQITQNPDFDKRWFEARNTDELKNIVLLAERRRFQ